MDFNEWFGSAREDVEKLTPGLAALAGWSAAQKFAEQQAAEGDDGFDDFWKLYPRKVAKPAAMKVWKRLKKKDKTAVLKFLPTSTWPAERVYIPHPATWLNQRRWEDELPEDDAPEQEFIL